MPVVHNDSTLNGAGIELGWVPSPSRRGTLDIIWGSLFTIFLCTWTAICLNIPHPSDEKHQILLRKAKWMFWGIVGPEIVLAVAIGQYASARRSVKRFKSLGYPQWTIRHAFFADMGGILLEPQDSTPFLVNSRQLAYLVERNYTTLPSISVEDIWDKSKADTMAKVLTVAQTLWFAVQLCGRAVQHLSTTTLELSAAAIVFCTFGTFVCWLHKPSDVQKGIQLFIPANTAQLLLEAGHGASKPYVHTPLDFVAKQSFTCGYDVMGMLKLRCDNRERPLRRFPNDRFPDISTLEKFALFCMTVSYAAIHLVGWNFYFPTQAERLLWRVSSLVFTGTTFSFWVFETIAARHRFGRWDKYLIWLGFKKTGSSIGLQQRNEKQIARMNTDDAFELEMKKSKSILWWEVAILLPVVVAYVLSRAYMMAEVFASLRKLPADAYQTVNVSRILPHW